MQTRKVRLVALSTAALVATVALAGCGAASASDEVTLRYSMWDASQMPGYRACAAKFTEQNPDITIQFEQFGWDDYWMQMTAGMVAEHAPDVFVNHTSRFGQYSALGQILDLEPYVKESGFDLDVFAPGLADQWLSANGDARYGIPKDWDTVAAFYNTEMLAESGYTPEDLWTLEWNPEDGGTFEQFIAHMTIDRNGVRGDEDGFDKSRVAVYGLGYNDAGSGYGQVQWSMYALSNGEWRWTNKNPWGTEFNYNSEDFQDSIGWWRSLIEKGYMPSLEAASSGIGSLASLQAGAYAVLMEGSWNIANVAVTTETGAFNVFPSPIGPDGTRASVQNGLADSVWVGTEHPDEAWQWVSFMGTAECQNIIAEQGVVFPAIMTSSDIAAEVFDGMGYDSKAFTVHIEEGTGVMSPVVDRWAQVESIMSPAMAAVISFNQPPSSLTTANNQVNQMMASNR